MLEELSQINIGGQTRLQGHLQGEGGKSRIQMTLETSVYFVCDFVFLQHGRQTFCFLNFKELIANPK